MHGESCSLTGCNHRASIRSFENASAPHPAGLLESTGGRGAIYYLPVDAIPSPVDVFGPPARISAFSPPNLAPSSQNLDGQRDPDGCLIMEQLGLPVPKLHHLDTP